jgi:hypothetical protein
MRQKRSTTFSLVRSPSKAFQQSDTSPEKSAASQFVTVNHCEIWVVKEKDRSGKRIVKGAGRDADYPQNK